MVFRACRYPELTCDYKKESDRKLIETNPINGIFRLFISKTKVNNVMIIKFQLNQQYIKVTKHSLQAKQMNLIINKIESEWTIFAKILHEFL